MCFLRHQADIKRDIKKITCGAIYPVFWKLHFFLFSAVSLVTWLVGVAVAVVVSVLVIVIHFLL